MGRQSVYVRSSARSGRERGNRRARPAGGRKPRRTHGKSDGPL